MDIWLAVLSGVIGGSTLLIGAALAWFVPIPQRVVAAIMAFGAGVLISTLAFELVAEAAEDGGAGAAATGFLIGALLYIGADWLISRRSHRHMSPDERPANIAARRSGSGSGSDEDEGSGVTIAVGALIDGIPESIVMGLSVLSGGISVPVVAAIAISNFPEGLSSTATLKRAGASFSRIAGLWGGIAASSVAAALIGFLAFQSAPPEVTAFVTTIAAGGLLAMVCNTMIPEAFEKQRVLTGLWATLGFLLAFALHELA